MSVDPSNTETVLGKVSRVRPRGAEDGVTSINTHTPSQGPAPREGYRISLFAMTERSPVCLDRWPV